MLRRSLGLDDHSALLETGKDEGLGVLNFSGDVVQNRKKKICPTFRTNFSASKTSIQYSYISSSKYTA